jgi:hypothetical protein
VTLHGNVTRVLALLLGSLPGVALACPVCFAAKDEANRVAFLITTVLLTALPVIMIGGVIVWLARRAREMDLEDRAEQQAQTAVAESSVAPERAEPGELIPLR